MKIIHFTSDLSPDSGGLVTAVLGLANAQFAQGHEVSILTTNYKTINPPDFNGIKIYLCACQFGLWRYSSLLKKMISGLILEADIVHLHSVWDYPVLAASQICGRHRKPYLLSLHGMFDRWSLCQKFWKKKIYINSIGRCILRNALALHVTSRKEKENSLFFGHEKKVFVSPLGLNASLYEKLSKPHDFFKRFPNLENRKFVLFLSRIHPHKQPDVVIRAFAEIFETHPGLCLVMAGSGEPRYLGRLKKIVSDLGLNNHVFFTGTLSGRAVQEAYSAAQLFILPSLHENFGFAIMEAMAAGCPVVASDCIDLADEIKDAGSGWLCEPTVKAMAAGMRKVLDDEFFRTKISENGRKLVLSRFTWDRAARDLARHYETILS